MNLAQVARMRLDGRPRCCRQLRRVKAAQASRWYSEHECSLFLMKTSGLPP